MNRLTRQERRRLYLARQRASQAMRADQVVLSDTGAVRGGRGRLRVARIVALFTLLCGGLAAYHLVEFHPPASVIEALLPRM